MSPLQTPSPTPVGGPHRGHDRRDRGGRGSRLAAVAPRPLVGHIRAAIVDEPRAADELATWLRRRGWEAELLPGTILSGPELRRELQALRPQLVLIDPESVAWSPWQWVPTFWEDMAVIVCTRPASVADRVRGLRAGVRYWLSKPVEPSELIAAIESVLRHRPAAPASPPPPSAVSVGELEIDERAWSCRAAGRELELTTREFALLAALAAEPERVLAREYLYQRAWGGQMLEGDRAVDQFVGKLRTKLHAASPDYAYIHTHQGRGYRFQAVPAGPAGRARSTGS